MIPAYPPTPVYRGDRYRLNMTAGALLSLVNSAPGGELPVDDAFSTLDTQNLLSGIPGGPAGSQWNPPPVLPGGTKDAKTGEPERFPDTLREHCTYFEPTHTRMTQVMRMLDFCGLIRIDSGSERLLATELGQGVGQLMAQAEERQRQIANKHSRMSPVQEYLAGDSRDTISPHTIPFDVYALNITGAVRTALDIYRQIPAEDTGRYPTPAEAFEDAPALTYAQSVTDGATSPDVTVEYNYGDQEFDSALPVRRHSYRKPTYRQFLWIAHNDRNTFVLAHAGVTDRTVEIVGTQKMYEGGRDAVDPDMKRVREVRATLRKIKPFASMVLTGGPESIWVGKPLNPKDVHGDCVSFTIASRAGFDDSIVRGSSIAWEVYDKSILTMRDYEMAREELHRGVKSGKHTITLGPAPDNIDPVEVARRAITEDENHPFMRIEQAGTFVERTSHELLREIGIDVEVIPETSSTGVPFDIRCTYVSKTSNTTTGATYEHRCKSKSIGGSGYCERHGGSYLSPEETASLVKATQQKLFAASSKSVEVMVELMLRSTNDAVRLRAAEQVLNRTGFGESRDLNVHLNATVDGETRSPSESIRERLAQLAGVSPDTQREIERRQKNDTLSEYGEPIEAEIIEVPDY